MTNVDLANEADTDEGQVLVDEVHDELNVTDETENELHSTARFSITAYGADLSVFDLRRRLGKEVLIPAPFQRKFVWTPRQASRFIESILMGLPVPGIFVFLKDKKQLIVDGQQRLITLDRFMSGVWETRTRKQGTQTVEVTVPFELIDVSEQWAGKTFDGLEDEDREQIENYLIHATIFRQDAPKERDRSIYEVFERINTGGLRLSAQEIRTCVSHGTFVSFLDEIVSWQPWRDVYGKRSPRMKDEELALRFFAFMQNRDNYTRPMAVFLDDYLEANKDLDARSQSQLEAKFKGAITTLVEGVGPRLFRPENAINAAVFDSVMVGMATRLAQGPVQSTEAVRQAYRNLLSNEEFQGYYRRATADDDNVKSRMRMAIEAFESVP